MAYYTAPSPDGSRNGTFYFNATDPSRWTRFALAPTTFHEAIPGHHLQLALAQELDLHPVLGELEVTAYGEGWGLYAERLADEMGLYATPLQRVGMLTLGLAASEPPRRRHRHPRQGMDPTAEPSTSSTTTPRSFAATSKPRSTATSPTPDRPPAT